MKERVDAYRVLVGKPEEKRLLRRPGGVGGGALFVRIYKKKVWEETKREFAHPQKKEKGAGMG